MPTSKQKRAAKNIVENGGNVSKGMRDAGYSPATAKTPQKLTESKGWLELLDEYIPDDKLQEVLKDGLEAQRIISAMNTGKQAAGATSDFIEVPDHAVRHRFLDTALKLKDKYPGDRKILMGDENAPLEITIIEDTKLKDSNEDTITD